MANADKIKDMFAKRKGVLRFVPNWIPRPFNRPGKRIRLHQDDYYCLGAKRGAITERWFCSVVPALNGPLAPADEGLSWISCGDDYEDKVYFKDVVAALGADLVGPALWEKYGTWPMFAKFFDNELPLFHHLHFRNEDAARVGRLGKPEAYYFPAQMNNHPGSFPVTYFGYDPDVTKEEVKRRLMRFESDDNRITELSRAYRLELGTGWYTPPGVVHAPGSLLTYEPQWNSDVNSVQENMVWGEVYGKDLLVSYLPEKERDDIDAAMALMDWEANVDPHYRKKNFLPPLPVDTGSGDWSEKWITYRNPYFAAKETTIEPGKAVVLRDEAAYGCIIIQGHGEFGAFADAECAVSLRHRQLSGDEYFVSEKAAREGVRVANRSRHEPMVILRHFGPNTGAPQDR